MTNTICLDEKYSTTKQLIQEKPETINNQNDKFETILFLPEGENRKGEGGLRTKGYFKKSFEKKPLISIITVVFNGEKFLEETIKSVINQTYENIEYIIIDGGSTDGTIDIIKKYEDKISYWVSESDKGISDAFNKGVKVAKGDYINFQGDGDGFYSPDSLEKVFQNINPYEDIFVSAMIQRISPEGEELYRSKYIENFDKKSLLFKMSMPHQGLFTHKSYFEKYGLFDINNTFCMDYDHLLRAYHEFPKVITKDIIVAKWRADGLGNGRTLEIFKEYDKIKRDNKIANNFVLSIVKYWTLFKYYVKKLIRND
ncbi:glycosyltransferase [Aliarcobacter butzleri]|uniref:glycosyltransferase family 2 protein n=1 Tax=Aliarcobacter butzleri TaxID=28197 RepID=UPI001EDBF654|nr:glycosyltransferase family 2 protein [Aliarcobacter butzleri]MCG3710612.1 glycosyltransferase [Aliarcobacter butzleri]MCG3714127.1 glycosyltransferase [Aliarcobacter butzleri]